MKFEDIFRKEPEKQYKVTGENLRIRVNFLNITHGSYKMDFLIFQLLQIQDLFFSIIYIGLIIHNQKSINNN